MMGIMHDALIVQHDHNMSGDGVVHTVNHKLRTQEITNDNNCEIATVKISQPIEIIIASVYRSPSAPIIQFVENMSHTMTQLCDLPICIVRDFNKDISITSNTHCFSIFTSNGFKQMVMKLTHDSGTLRYHVHVTQTVQIVADVTDCYYSDLDCVLCATSI